MIAWSFKILLEYTYNQSFIDYTQSKYNDYGMIMEFSCDYRSDLTICHLAR